MACLLDAAQANFFGSPCIFKCEGLVVMVMYHSCAVVFCIVFISRDK